MRQKMSGPIGSRYQGRPGMGVRSEKLGIAAHCGRGWRSAALCPYANVAWQTLEMRSSKTVPV
jgi:hypothetical protein